MVVNTGAALANGLRNDFVGTYMDVMNRTADSRISMIMDYFPADNRVHEFSYAEAAPHLERWIRGSTIPTGGFDFVQFSAKVYEYAKRISWRRIDREDERTGSLFPMAQQAGQSAGLLPERFAFDLISGSTATLPNVPLAPDGVVLYSTTDGSGGARFGASSGNLLTGSGIASAAAIISDYYAGIEQYGLFQDGQGQPLLSPELISQGVLIIHSMADTEAFETAFLQLRQGRVYGSNTAAAAVSNLVYDSSRNVDLYGSPRLATGDWYMFLKAAPQKPLFTMEREGLRIQTALADDNNSDYVRDTGMEYIQFEIRLGAGIALPYATIKVNN